MRETVYTTDLIQHERKFFPLSAASRIVVSFFKVVDSEKAKIPDEKPKGKIDIRLWYTKDGEIWQPTRKGVAIRVELIRDNLIAILQDFCKNGDHSSSQKTND